MQIHDQTYDQISYANPNLTSIIVLIFVLVIIGIYLLHRNTYQKQKNTMTTKRLYQKLLKLCLQKDLQGIDDFLNNNKSFNVNKIFEKLCEPGYDQIFIHLYNHLKNNNMVFDVHYDEELYFTLAAYNQSIQLLDFLYQFEPDLRIRDDIVFDRVCNGNKSKTINWLISKCPDYLEKDGKYYIRSDSVVHYFKYDDFGKLNYKKCDAREKIKIADIDSVNQQITEAKQQLTETTYFDASTIKDTMDHRIRDSKISTKKIKLDIKNINGITDYGENLIICESFDYIQYNVGGHFDKHVDVSKFVDGKEHNYTILLFPPQKIDGGDFIIYEDKEKESMRISPSEFQWTIIIFPVGTYHCSTEITNGIKITLKGSFNISQKNKTESDKRRFDSENMICDGAYRIFKENQRMG